MQFNLMCGHDVTVLPLLHVLGATREANTWPAYCCALMVELLRIWQHYTQLSLVCSESSGKLAVETTETLPCELESFRTLQAQQRELKAGLDQVQELLRALCRGPLLVHRRSRSPKARLRGSPVSSRPTPLPMFPPLRRRISPSAGATS